MDACGEVGLDRPLAPNDELVIDQTPNQKSMQRPFFSQSP
jgi:hypothetical protein